MTDTPSPQIPTTTADHHPSEARIRLDRLDNYLKADPSNEALLLDAFQAALASSQWNRAADYLRRGQSLQSQSLKWALNESEFWLAQSLWPRARAHLEGLLNVGDAPPEFRLAVAHNLGFIAFQEGDFATCVSRLAGHLEADSQFVVSPVTQQMWLRALHRTGELERACRWASLVEASGKLSPQGASIASLIALDAEQVASAQRWSDLALRQLSEQDRPLEALATRASLALAANDAAAGQKYALAALRISPTDGRAWSVLAFAQLLTGQLQAASQSFMKALTTMPQHIGTWHGQGWTQILLHDLDAALASFEAALALDRNFAESHGGLAVVLAMQDKVVLAQDHIARAERLDKSNLTGRYARSILNGEARDAQALQRLAQHLLADKPALFGGSIADVVKRKPL